jgi:hypothetical protein
MDPETDAKALYASLHGKDKRVLTWLSTNRARDYLVVRTIIDFNIGRNSEPFTRNFFEEIF